MYVSKNEKHDIQLQKDCTRCQQSPTVTVQFIYLCISLFFQQVADWALGTLSMKFTNSSINSLRKITAKHLSTSHISETNVFRFKIQHQLYLLFWDDILLFKHDKARLFFDLYFFLRNHDKNDTCSVKMTAFWIFLPADLQGGLCSINCPSEACVFSDVGQGHHTVVVRDQDDINGRQIQQLFLWPK